jgi:hypothetical protein
MDLPGCLNGSPLACLGLAFNAGATGMGWGTLVSQSEYASAVGLTAIGPGLAGWVADGAGTFGWFGQGAIDRARRCRGGK